LLRTVLFDLDGTLVDTAPDLAYTLNLMRQRRRLPPLPAEILRAEASHGSQGLIRLGLGVAQDQPEFPVLREEFLEIYRDHLCDASTLFPGMDALLNALGDRGVGCGVVTNKPARFAEPLLERLGLLGRLICVVSGDTCAYAKPHPAPMQHACVVAGSRPSECLYLGDARRDVEAAAAVGMPVLVALYGYLSETDEPATWGADGFIRSPLDLLDSRYLRN
jgi:2-phosphoglycolate phosphatase